MTFAVRIPSFSRLRSLKSRILLAALFAILLGMWSLSFFASHMLREDMERVLGNQQFSTITLIAAEIDEEIEKRIRALARTNTLAAQVIPHGATAIRNFLDGRVNLLALFNGGLVVVDTAGKPLADTAVTASRPESQIADNDAITTTLQTGKAAISRPLPGRTTKTASFALSAPIFGEDDKIIGALIGFTDIKDSGFLDQISKNHYGKTGSYLLIAPRHRQIVTGTDLHRVMDPFSPQGKSASIDSFITGTEGSAVRYDAQGAQVLASFKRIPAADWVVVADLPMEEAFAPVRDMQRRMWLVTSLLSLAVIALISWILKRQLAPLESTALLLATLPDERLPSEPLPVVQNDEVGQLIGRFNEVLGAFRQREMALRESEERFKVLHDASFGGIAIHDHGIIIDCNQGLSELTGYDKDELIGSDVFQLIAPEWRDDVRERAFSGNESTSDAVGLRKDGSLYPLTRMGKNIHYKGKLVRVSEFRDISERKRAEEKQQLAASVFSHAREAILITRSDGAIIDVNDAFTRITGYTRDEVIGKNPRILGSGRQRPEFFATLWEALREKGHWYGEIWNRRKNGDIYATQQAISTVFDARRVPQHHVALFSDITALKEHERQLEHIAHYDVLTTLPNRVLLADRMKQAMAQAERRKQLLAVAYLDLDGFKSINDQHGHETGDRLLIALAERMKQSLREGDTLARLGGDEFIAVLIDLGSPGSSIPLLSRMLEATARPIAVGDVELNVSASIGVTFYPQAEEVDADQLLRQADQAMYQAKLAGKNRFHLFDAEQDRNVRGFHESLEHIRQALDAREFVLYYQPKVNMRTGAVIGVEALIRWQHPQRGLLSPGVFLPVIEDHPLAIDVGEWVIDGVLSQIETWLASAITLPVSINVGGRQLLHGDFVQRLRDALARHPDVQPGLLEIEVLETSALEDLTRVSQIIEDCRSLGIGFALDDFGTGYSSLTYLKRLSVNQLKIDQSFVRGMLDDPDDLSILGGVLNMATAFRRQVLAEGVETVAHGTMLLQLGCELAQGYGIARPMPAASVPAWVADWRPDETWSAMKPASRDDLPLLFAGVEHRAWIIAVEDFLNGKRNTLPISHHQCGFKAWLGSEGAAMHRDQPVFHDILPLHQDLHQLASRLCTDQALLSCETRAAGIAVLHSLRNELIEQLQILIVESQQSASERERFNADTDPD